MLFYELALLQGITVLDPKNLGIRSGLPHPISEQLQKLPITRLGDRFEHVL
jgi:hypothetical protein